MIGLGARIGLPDRVDHPREPPANTPCSAGQCPDPARRSLDPIRLHSNHSFQNDHVRLARFGGGSCGTVRQTRFSQRQLKIPHVRAQLRQGGCVPVPVGSRLSANKHRLRPLAASAPVPDAGNALGPKDMAGELIEISW